MCMCGLCAHVCVRFDCCSVFVFVCMCMCEMCEMCVHNTSYIHVLCGKPSISLLQSILSCLQRMFSGGGGVTRKACCMF